MCGGWQGQFFQRGATAARKTEEMSPRLAGGLKEEQHGEPPRAHLRASQQGPDPAPPMLLLWVGGGGRDL